MTSTAALDRAFSEGCLITTAEAARLLDVDVKTLRRHVADGELGCRTIGQGKLRPRLRFGRDDIEAFMERMKKRPTGPASVIPSLKIRSTTLPAGAASPSFSELQAKRAGSPAALKGAKLSPQQPKG